MLSKERKIATQLHKERLETRGNLFRRADVQHDRYARKSGAFMWGTDKNGKKAPTKTLRKLGIEGPDGEGFVVVPFKRSDIAKMKGIPAEEADKIIKKGEEPKKTVKIKLHIMAAVRQAEHICDNYPKEIATTDRLLAALDALNVQLSEMRKPPAAEIDAAVALLALFKKDVLSKKRAPEKSIASVGKLDRLIGMLEALKSSTNPAFDLGSLCRVFVAFRDRLGPWRDERVAGISKYNRQKEYALRKVRDEWAYSQLVRFAEDVDGTFRKFMLEALPDDKVLLNSPRYLLNELEKSGDKYLFGLLLELEPAVNAFEKRKPTARGDFIRARDRLGIKINPQWGN